MPTKPEICSGQRDLDAIHLRGDATSKLRYQYKCFVFDCDGVLWKGTDAIEGCSTMIDRLRAEERKLLFATNNSLHTPKGIVDKMNKIGIEGVTEEEIICPANVLPEVAFEASSVSEDPSSPIAVFGSQAIVDGCRSRLEGTGKKILQWSDLESRFSVPLESNDMHAIFSQFESFDSFEPLPSVFVIGYDLNFSWYKTAFVTRVCQIREDRGLHTVVLQSNGDVTLPCSWGLSPGAGSTFASYKEALTNFKRVTIENCGKPFKRMADLIVDKTQLPRDDICMIGDNLFTDIEFGSEHLGASILVLTGIHSREDVERNQMIPTYIIDSAACL